MTDTSNPPTAALACKAHVLGVEQSLFFPVTFMEWKHPMGLLNASCGFTRFKITEGVPKELWEQIPAKLKQFAFRDIDDIPEERAWGWVSFEDMLDGEWLSIPPDKGAYLAFAFRLDTRRIPPAVLKKHVQIALREEEHRIKEQGKKFIGRDRKLELRDQVRLRLMGRFLPIPAVFDVAWNTESNIVYLTSTQTKLIELFMEYFTLTFDLHLEPLTPYSLAASFLDDAAIQRLDTLEPTRFA